jgi:hypothetical protein
MLRKRKDPKAKNSIAETLARDLQGTAAEKLAMQCSKNCGHAARLRAWIGASL